MWIQLLRPFDLREGPVVPPDSRQTFGITLRSRGIARIEFDSPTEFALCAGPVPVEYKLRPRQRVVHFSEFVIQLERLHRCRLGVLQGLPGRQCSKQVPTEQ